MVYYRYLYRSVPRNKHRRRHVFPFTSIGVASFPRATCEFLNILIPDWVQNCRFFNPYAT